MYTISSAAEVTAMKQGKILYGLETMTRTGAVQLHGGHRFGGGTYKVWGKNMAGQMYQANPTAYPTVSALNNAAWAKYQAMLKADNSGGFLNFVGNYVQPAVQALVLWEVGGAFYSGVTAGGGTASAAELSGQTVNLANSGATTAVDTGSQALVNTGQVVDLGNTAGTVLDAGSGATIDTGSALLNSVQAGASQIGDGLVTTGEGIITGKIASAVYPGKTSTTPQGQTAQPQAAPAASKSGIWAMIGIGALVAAKLLVFT